MLFGLIVVIGISLLIIVHEAGHFIAAKQAGLKVEEFGFGFPPRIFAIKKGETEYSFNWIPFGGFVKIYGESKEQMERRAAQTGEIIDPKRSFAHQSAWRRLTIVFAGVAINFFAGWLLLSLVFMVGAPQAVVITGVAPESPAALAGILPGDQVLQFKTASDFIHTTEANRGKELPLEITREGKVLNLVVTPRLENVKGQGATGVIISEAGFEKLPFFASLWKGLTTSLEVMGQILQTFGSMISRLFVHAELLDGVVGPIGIWGVANQLGGLGLVYLMQLIGMISLNLAVLNAIPFPALDGGRFLFIIIEKIKGSPIGQKKELVFNLVGFGLLFILMIAITGRDIIRLF